MIHSLQDTRLPVIGKIRLGIRKETQTGVEYPESVDYFVLTDAPELIKVYGEKPKEIDAFFLTDDLDEAIPNWLKWYGAGKRDKDGKVVGGKLNCYGTGPATIDVVDPETGEVVQQSVPGKAFYMKEKDLVTKIIPERPCLGEKCPDYYDKNGRAQCGPTMKVNIMVPLASMSGIFEIDTKSITSMRMFIRQLTHLKKQFGHLTGIPFKIYRNAVSMNVPNKPGQQKIHYILSIKVNEGFREEKGAAIQNKMQEYSRLGYTGPSEDDSINRPMEDHYRLESNAEEKVDFAKTVITDPEVVQLFARLAELKVPYNEQKQLLTARKFETVADPKASLVEHLKSVIASKETVSQIDATFQDKGVQDLFAEYAKLIGRDINPGSVRATIVKFEKEPDVKAATVKYLNTQIASAKEKKAAEEKQKATSSAQTATVDKKTEKMNQTIKGIDEKMKEYEEKIKPKDIETQATDVTPPTDPNDHGLI